MKASLIVIFLALGLQTYGQLIQDESYMDFDFWKFKVELEKCILAKDTTILKRFLADMMYISSDDCLEPNCSKEEFMRLYFNDDNEDVWNEMLTIIRFGFSRIEDKMPESIVPHEKIVFQAPSYLKAVDTDNEVIILGENVNIREKPSLKSKVIRQATFEKFKCDCNILTMTESTFQIIDGVRWLEIKLERNKIGYVASKFTSYELIKEMTVAKIKGKWKIISYSHSPGC